MLADKNLLVLTGGMFCLSACYTMLVPFLPVYLLELGVPQESVPMWSGLVFSVTFLVAGVMAPIWGKLADNHGKKKMAIRAAVGIGVSYFLGGIVTGPLQLMGMRAVQGFANGYMPAAMALIASSAPKQKLGEYLGIFQTGQIMGGIVGPLLGGIIAEVFGMRNSFFIAAFMLGGVSLMVHFKVSEKRVALSVQSKESSIMDDLRYAMKNRNLMELLTLNFLLQSAVLMLQPVLALYIGQLQGSMDNVIFLSGVVLSLGGLAGTITTPWWGRFGQQHGYFKAMSIAFTGAGIFLFLQYFPTSVMGFGILQFFSGAFIVGANPSLNAALATCAPTDFRGRVFGLSTTAQQFGNMFGPLFASAITMFMGIQYVFIITGILLVLLGWRIYMTHLRMTVA